MLRVHLTGDDLARIRLAGTAAGAPLESERARVTWTMTHAGTAALLDSLHPAITWNPPVLEIDVPGQPDRELDAGGRGLVLAPALGGSPRVDCQDGDAQLTLIYPATAPDAPRRSAERPPLAALLGETRAAVLRAIAARSCSTTELAARTGTALSSASHHAAVLRESGLVDTYRDGPAVRHQVTARGTRLLDAEADPACCGSS